ncbi:DUF296 domain-containing protein, partial [Cephalotus follicularis]
MKGEYLKPKNDTPTNMFSKLHQHPQHHHQHQQLLPFSHHFQLSRECSEDDDSHSRSTGGGAATPTNQDQSHKTTTDQPTTTAGDGATIEVSRRPRGRPPGSKNKPKPPVFITRDPEPAMSPYILEVPAGIDVVEVISRFCRRKNIGLCVFTGSGTVANVTLRQPSTNPGSTVTFHGRFDILSISATFIPQTASYQIPNIFTISLAGPQGQIVGGAVAGALVAASTVYVIAATFNNPTFHRLAAEEEARNSLSGGERQSPPGSGGGGGGGGGEGGHVSESMSMYSCHLPPGNDVIWAPTARPPRP